MKRNIKAFIVTALVCVTMVAYMIAIAPSFGKDIQQIIDLKFPKVLQSAFGFSGLDFGSANGFFALSFSYIYLFISIYLAGVFSTIVSKEFSDKTAEFLFTLPAKRLNIIITKLSAAFLYSFFIVIAIFIAAWLSLIINIKDGYNLHPIILMIIALFIGGNTFGSIGFFLSSFFARSRSVFAVSAGFVLVMYLLQIVILVNDKLSFLKYISPFDWFKGSDINKTGEISLVYCAIAFFITAVTLAAGIRRYKKMDVLI